jgi:cell division protease FtsH
MDMMAEALMQYETIDAEQIDAIMEGRKPNPPSDWSDGSSDSPSDPEASSPNDDAMGDPVTH